MSRTSSLTFDIVSEDIATETRKHSDTRAWAHLLEDGQMLRMSHRPQWLPSDRKRTGKKLRTKAVGDSTTDVYCWLIVDADLPQPDSPEYALESVLSEA